MQFKFGSAAAILAIATLLSACGGGDEGFVVEEKDPSPSGASATMTVSAATGPDAVFNGVFRTADRFLNNVTRVNPIGGSPETCRFKFSNLPQVGTPSRGMSGDIRYFPDSAQLNVAFVSVGSTEFSISGTTTNVTIDRANNRVVFAGAVLTSTQNTGRSITLNGAIPMRGDRPGGC